MQPGAPASVDVHIPSRADKIVWRWLLAPADVDVLLLSGCVLLLNLALVGWVLEDRRSPLRYKWGRALSKLAASLKPTNVPIYGLEDLGHALVQLGCAAYAGRVAFEWSGLMAPQTHPFDLGTCDGIALHVTFGFLVWGFLSGVGHATSALHDAFAAWRWSPHAVVHQQQAS